SVVGSDDADEFYTEYRSFDDTAWNTWMPQYFIQVMGTTNYRPMARGFLDISRNTVRGARRGFIQLVLGGAQSWDDISLCDNQITLWATAPRDPVFLLDSNNQGELRRLTDRGNHIVVKQG